MGYTTYFDLTITPAPDEAMKHTLDKVFGLYRWEYDHWYGNLKWYEYRTDIEDISKVFPDYLFRLVGDGEETGDYWVLFAKAGRSYTKSLVLPVPEFDEAALDTAI